MDKDTRPLEVEEHHRWILVLLVFYREPAWRQSKSRRARELRPIIFKTGLRFQAAFKAWRCVYGVTWLSRLSRVRYSCSSKRSGSGETQPFLSFFARPFLAREKPMTRITGVQTRRGSDCHVRWSSHRACIDVILMNEPRWCGPSSFLTFFFEAKIPVVSWPSRPC